MKRCAGPAIVLAGALALAAVAADAQTLRWASQGDPQTMDPHSQNESMTNMMNGQVYERLTNRDRQLNIVPGLATSWEQTGPLTWRFKLRPNVKFHDGSPFTADDVVYTQISNDATRLAALVSGEIDFVLDPAPRDVPRLRNTPGVKVIDGPENRIVFIGMDQLRDELLYSNVKGKNPFKDVRVRRALYHAVDVETLKRTVMRGQALPTGAIMPSPLGDFNDPEIEGRLPYDMAKAKALLAE